MIQAEVIIICPRLLMLTLPVLLRAAIGFAMAKHRSKLNATNVIDDK